MLLAGNITISCFVICRSSKWSGISYFSVFFLDQVTRDVNSWYWQDIYLLFPASSSVVFQNGLVFPIFVSIFFN